MSSGDTTTPTDESSSSATPATTGDADAPEEVVETDDRREAQLADLRVHLGDAIVGSHIEPGHALWVRIDRASWAVAGEVVSRTLGYSFFDFLSAIDWMPSPFGRDMDSQEDVLVHGADAKEPPPMTTGTAGGDTRFQVLARVYDIEAGLGLLLKVDLDDDAPALATWTPYYAGVNWHERETAEMFGIDFPGHPDLTHIYLPTEFEGHPLRKDFPLTARRVRPWPGIVDVEPMPGADDDAGEGDE